MLFLACNTVIAGGWTQKKGLGFYKVGFRFVRASKFYEPNGNRISIPTLGEYTTSFYGEYGLNDRITAVAYVPFFKRITLNRQVGQESGFVFFEGDSVSGFADIDAGLRIGLKQNGATVVSASILFGFPIGEDSQQNGLLTGDGEFNQAFALQIGHSFYPAPAYLTGEVGYNNRTNGYSDELRYGLEFGYTLAQKLTIILRATGVESIKNGEDSVLGGMGGLYANNQRYLAYGPELAYAFTKHIGVSIGVELATRAQNVLSAPAFSVGLQFKN